MSDFQVRYWGVRGSIPVPGPDTVRYGGNTTCIEVRCGDELMIIDAGSGIRVLGNHLVDSPDPVKATILFSHLHWDHILGFPFFTPAFTPGTTLGIYCDRRPVGNLKEVMRGQMAEPTFPVSLDSMGAEIDFHEFSQGDTLRLGDCVVKTAALNHPGGATGFRFEYKGKVFVHASDHEHLPTGFWQPLVDLARGADYFSVDSTYTDAEYHGTDGGLGHIGWGHSTWQENVKLANEAGVGELILFHHEPNHTDDDMDLIGALAKEQRPATRVAREGMVIDLDVAVT